MPRARRCPIHWRRRCAGGAVSGGTGFGSVAVRRAAGTPAVAARLRERVRSATLSLSLAESSHPGPDYGKQATATDNRPGCGVPPQNGLFVPALVAGTGEAFMRSVAAIFR